MAVGGIITRVPRRNRRIFSGQFTGANGSVGSVAFKGEITVAYVSEGVYDLTIVDGKQGRLSRFNATVINPATTDGGSGRVVVSADTVATNGVFRVAAFNQADAAADIIGVAKIEIVTEGEAS